MINLFLSFRSIVTTKELCLGSSSSLYFFFFQNLESLEAQLADASSERNKATETISSLQVIAYELA